MNMVWNFTIYTIYWIIFDSPVSIICHFTYISDDVFGIEELTIYKGKLGDNNYACAGDVLDGYLYDLLMNLLEEKGITNEFAYKLSDLSTVYEHSSYVQLLESLSKFTSAKWMTLWIE